MMSKMPPLHELPPYEPRKPEFFPHEVNDAARAQFTGWLNIGQGIDIYVSPAHAKTWRGRLLFWLAGMPF